MLMPCGCDVFAYIVPAPQPVAGVMPTRGFMQKKSETIGYLMLFLKMLGYLHLEREQV
jgi:hypothetical protein